MAAKRSTRDTSGKAETVWQAQAIDDVERIAALVEVHSITASRKIKAVIWDNVRRLSEFPRIGKLQQDGKGRLWVARHGAGAILINYRTPNDTIIVITSIKHSKEHK